MPQQLIVPTALAENWAWFPVPIQGTVLQLQWIQRLLLASTRTVPIR